MPTTLLIWLIPLPPLLAFGLIVLWANRTWWLAVFIAVVMFGALLALLAQMPTWWQAAPPLMAAGGDFLIEDLGASLVDLDRYVVPFEAASVLLLAALIGAIVLARPGDPADRPGKGNGA